VNICPEILQQYLGVDGTPHRHAPGTSGAGAMPEDALLHLGETSVDQDMETHDNMLDSLLQPQEAEALAFVRQQLQSEEAHHVRHPPVKVSPNNCPFQDSSTQTLFWEALSLALSDNSIPHGYGLFADEWETDTYPELQYIGGGRKRDISLDIPLPSAVWYPRAVEWGVALHIMNAFLAAVDS
jgi:hypothetical protein